MVKRSREAREAREARDTRDAHAGDATPARNAAPRLSMFTVRTLAQAKLLSHPLKLRLLKEFVAEPRTTMQVAERIGESAPKLYRHVDALADAGLLELKEERKKRGTTERYYQAVASRFEVDRTLFAADSSGEPHVPRELAHVVKSLFSDTQRELIAHMAEMGRTKASPPIAMRIVMRGSKKRVAELRAKLTAILAECQSMMEGSGDGASDVEECAGLIVLYSTSLNDDGPQS